VEDAQFIPAFAIGKTDRIKSEGKNAWNFGT
jgi:hypothetical protein